MKASKFNKASIMRTAWGFFKYGDGTKTFAECLQSSWDLAKAQVAMDAFLERAEAEREARNAALEAQMKNRKVIVHDNRFAAEAYEMERANRGKGIYWGD